MRLKASEAEEISVEVCVLFCQDAAQKNAGVSSLPDGEDPAEIIHDVVELNLQVFQDLAGLLAQLRCIRKKHKCGERINGVYDALIIKMFE